MFDGIFWDNDVVLMETDHLYYRANADFQLVQQYMGGAVSRLSSKWL